MGAVRGRMQERASRILHVVGSFAGASACVALRLPGVTRRTHVPARFPATRLLPVCLLLAMAACTTPQQRAARNQAEVERMMVEYGPACERLGYTPSGDGWRECVLRLNARDDLQRYPASPGFYDGGGPGWYGGGGWWRPIW